jgi:hypothetical protein
MKEMEELIIESNIKKEGGPLRSVWEAAVERRRQQKDHDQNMSEHGGKKSNFWEAEVVPKEEGRASLPPADSRSSTVGPIRFPSYSQLVASRARSVSY